MENIKFCFWVVFLPAALSLYLGVFAAAYLLLVAGRGIVFGFMGLASVPKIVFPVRKVCFCFGINLSPCEAWFSVYLPVSHCCASFCCLDFAAS
jgi:ABC-type phosphate transport system permease subunit